MWSGKVSVTIEIVRSRVHCWLTWLTDLLSPAGQKLVRLAEVGERGVLA